VGCTGGITGFDFSEAVEVPEAGNWAAFVGLPVAGNEESFH
jgi:hypothetical protein